MRTHILTFLIMAAATASAAAQPGSDVVPLAPALARMISTGKLEQVRNPSFTDPNAAKAFARQCRQLALELDRLPTLSPEHAELRDEAALAAEFLAGETFDLSTSKIESVVALRDSVGVPPPSSLVYLRKYKSTDTMPSVVRRAFKGLNRSNVRVQGVTMRGRYIAILHSEYPEEVKDVLAHELVHAYLSVAAGTNLPTWFQEGAAVYFSTGPGKLYNHGDDPSLMEDVTMPGDYKSALHSFEFIERKVGKEELFAFIRRGVETGNPDAQLAMAGVDEAPPPPIQLSRIVFWLIVAGVIIWGAVALLRYRGREEMW